MSAMPVRTVARKSHTKRRSGCGICKKRKIRCDEQKPQCGNCIRHNVSCTFANEMEASPLSMPSNQSAGTSYYSPETIDQEPTNPPIEPDEASDSSLVINSSYLELLHHYATVTSYTLTANELLRAVWRIEVPKLGFDHPFLMRSIFAVTAVHIARLSPNKKDHYLAISKREHQMAISEVGPLLLSVTPENCSALYAFSILTFIYKWAAPQRGDEGSILGESGMSEWLSLFRGIRSIAEAARQNIMDGPLGPLIRFGGRREQIAEPMRSSAWWFASSKYTHLERLFQNLSKTTSSPQTLAVYEKAVRDLGACFCGLTISSPGDSWDQGTHADYSHLPESSSVYAWLYKASDEYLKLLNQSDQGTLVIFAHFCIVLKSLDGYWWMQGWCEHLLSLVHEMLQPDYRLWIQWPMEEIGWNKR